MLKQITLLLMFFFCISAFSNADDFSDAIVKAKTKLKEAEEKNDIQSLLKVRGDFERILQLKKNQWLVYYYMASIDFSISYIAMKSNNMDEVKKYTESSISLLNKAIELNENFTEAYILMMAVQSNRWMYEMEKMNDIIAKQSEAKDIASQQDPNNPRFYLIDGMNTYYTPENFGGGADNALPLFEKSFELFGTFKPVDETYPDWGRDLSAGMIAMCMIKKDKLVEAKKWIDKGLELDPESSFIKEQVLPEYEKKKK